MRRLAAPSAPPLPTEWTGEYREIVVAMCILTASKTKTPAHADTAFNAARAIYSMSRPLPSHRGTLRYRGVDITIAVTNSSYQITVKDAAMIESAQAFVSQLFYGSRLPRATMRYTNVNCALAVAPGYSLNIGILRLAVIAGRCPGLSIKQCSHPRHAASRIIYLVCTQPGKKKARYVTVIAGAEHISIIGVCDLRVSAYTGALRRIIADSGALGRVDHRDAFWPLAGARMTPDVRATLAFIAAHPVCSKKPSRRPARGNK